MINKISLFLLLCGVVLLAQENSSIHQTEYEKYKFKKLGKSDDNGQPEELIKLNKSVKKNLTHSVFGYYPDWEYLDNSHNYFNYELLTHIAAFDFTVSQTGQISDPAGWPWTGVINQAHSNGVKVIMVVVNFNASEIKELMTNTFYRWAFMIGVQSKIKTYQLDGVNIDFEGLNVADRGDLINEFMQELTDSVHSINSELEVSFAAPAVNWGGWKLTDLANSCDYLFVMGYDFYGSWSDFTGPTAPLTGGDYNVTNTINVEYGTVSTFYPEKLILGVPYFGPHWKTSSSNEGAAVTGWVGSERYRSAIVGAESYGLNWSNTFKNSWYDYMEGGETHQVWFDDDSSLGLKYDLAIAKNLKGIGMWALGYDGTKNELWNLISEKFTAPVGILDGDKVPTNFELSQNYPNPFNPSTKISYSISNFSNQLVGEHFLSSNNSPSSGNGNIHVSLIVYDILGREITTLINSNQLPGNYEVSFDGSSLTSGVYYYQLKAGQFLKTKKMVLSK